MMQATVTIKFEAAIAAGGDDIVLDFSLHGLSAAPRVFELIDEYKLPVVSPRYQLLDWSRSITGEEFLGLVGPADFDVLLKKHRSLRFMHEWRQEPGHEGHYSQIDLVALFVSEVQRGNKIISYQLTVSDMG